MKVQDVMSHNVICVEMDARLPDVKRMMEEQGFHHLPVVENDKLVGIISDRDLLRLISPFIDTAAEHARDLDTLNRAAHQIMTRQPITVSVETDIQEAVNWMLKVDISCVPVVDAEQHVLGIVTWRDLVKHAKF